MAGETKRALIAMSGGVDSSVAAFLMKERGFDCTGATMKLFGDEAGDAPANPRTCCSLEDTEAARSVARSLEMPFHVFNFARDFRERVIDKFVQVYERGGTPNPCIDCNRYLKFEKLLHRARELDMDYVVTGHYARIGFDEQSGRWQLRKGSDAAKDQSYALYTMTQEQLSRTLFPLGEYTKPQIREIAERRGFVNANKPDSQDICFVRDGDYAGFIEAYTGRTCQPGDFVDANSGRVLGRHGGVIRYTVGQRRGLGLGTAHPMYVQRKDAAANTVTLSANVEDLHSRELIADDFNWIALVPKIGEQIRVSAKIRYNQREQPASASVLPCGSVRVEFDTPQKAVADGQAVVLYDGEIVVGGGVIK
jgi:tRNA-specific 2-thiouridylase